MFYDRFSNKASELFLLSQKEAESLGHAEIDPEHFLLALLKDPTHEISILLKSQFGIDYVRIRNEIINMVGTGFGQRSSPQPSLKFRKILEKAYEDARLLNIQHIEIEHIILAIYRIAKTWFIKCSPRLASSRLCWLKNSKSAWIAPFSRKSKPKL